MRKCPSKLIVMVFYVITKVRMAAQQAQKFSKLEEDKESLKSEITILKSRIALIESDKRLAEDESRSLRNQVEMLKESAAKYRYSAELT